MVTNKTKEQFERHCELAQNVFPEEDYIWFGTFLYGSQNYGLDTEESDVDTISLYVPTIKTLSRENNHTKFLSMEKKFNAFYPHSDVKDHVVFKDIRIWIEELAKGSPHAIELVYTDYNKINGKFHEAWGYLIAQDILKIYPENTVKALVGMTHAALKSAWLPRKDNEKDNEMRYNVKAFSESIRLIHALFNYIKPGSNYSNIFIPKGAVKDFILCAKNGELKYEDAKAWTGVCEYILRNFVFFEKPVQAFTDGPEFLRDWIEGLFEMALIKS